MKMKTPWSDTPEKKKRYTDFDLRIKTELKKLPNDLTDIPQTVEVFTSNQILFLEEYKKNGLNVDQALAISDVAKTTYYSWLRRPGFVEVLQKIQDCYVQAVLADGKTVAGWGIEILKDLHTNYKNGDSKSANALAQMAGHMLKATGNFDSTDGAKTPQVLIQINTSGKKQETKEKTVEPSPSGEGNIQLNFNANGKRSAFDMSELF